MLKKWFKKRQERKASKSTLCGYKLTASVILMQHDESLKRMMSTLQVRKDLGYYNDFDKGVDRAIADARSLGIIK